MRYLYTADDQLFAYAPGRRDFFRAGDDRLFAHESHGWLIAAESGETLAHRTGDVYYGALDGEQLFHLRAEPLADAVATEPDADESARPRRGNQRVARRVS